MQIPPFKTINFKDYEVNRFQASVAEIFNSIRANQFLVGNFIDSIKDENPSSATFGKSVPIILGTTKTKVPHGLKRNPIGYFILFQNQPAMIYRPDPVTDQEKKDEERENAIYLPLKASAAVTVKLWVF